MSEPRVHIYTDCDNLSGNDTLALSEAEVIERANCEDCLAEHSRYDDYDPYEDMYWSGTGELMNDDSYIDYLNNY